MFTMPQAQGILTIHISMWMKRKEKLAKMEEDGQRELGMLPEKEFSPRRYPGEVR